MVNEHICKYHQMVAFESTCGEVGLADLFSFIVSPLFFISSLELKYDMCMLESLHINFKNVY